MDPNFQRTTDRRVEITHRDDGIYEVDVAAGPTFEGGLLNVGGRAAAFPPGGTFELGGGDTEVVVRGYDDGRADDGTLLAIGFTSTTIL